MVDTVLVARRAGEMLYQRIAEMFTETPRVRSVIVLVLLVGSVPACFGQWTKTIRCTAGRIYRDVRENAGREEFCEFVLSGSLVVKDGPYRSWFSEGHPGSVGNYLKGREVGTWQECNRFDQCRQVLHERVFPAEKKRASFTPEIPVSYERGEYAFDFASCRSTWVTQIDSADPISLNINGGYDYGCQIAYLPESAVRKDVGGDYVCWIPFTVGRRKFASLDLKREFPKAGLPQFCRAVSKLGEPLMIREGAMIVASTVDVKCATIDRLGNGRDFLKIELNDFASRLAAQVEKQEGPLNTLLSQFDKWTPHRGGQYGKSSLHLRVERKFTKS